MKKLVCMLLALLMIVSMAACQKESGEAVKGTGVEDSLTEASETVTFETPREYENALHDLGFAEYSGDLVRLTMNSGVGCVPQSLTYNQEAFRLEFSYLDYADKADTGNLVTELTPVTGWVLYGKKNGENPDNISDYKAKDYDAHDTEDPYGLPDTSFCKTEVYHFYNSGRADLIVNAAYYYPGTGNLYNLLNTQPDAAKEATLPKVLCETEEALSSGLGFVDQVNHGIQMPADKSTKLYKLVITFDGPTEAVYARYPGGVIETYFESGMTFLEWAQSQYAGKKEWAMMENLLLFAPGDWDVEANGAFCITDADKAMEEVVTFDSDNCAAITTEKLPEGMELVSVDKSKAAAASGGGGGGSSSSPERLH